MQTQGMQSEGIVFSEVNTAQVQAITLPELQAGQVLIETAYSFISPGTELRCLAGKQDGATFPLISGYSMAGTVVEVGEGVDLAVGTHVYCNGTLQADVRRTWGGHVSHAIQKVENVFVIPDGVDLLEASGAHIAAIAYHGMHLSQPMAHERVIVIGLGVIGQFSARLHALSGAEVLGVDLSAERVAQLQAVGVDAVASIEAAKARFPDGADIIVDATGTNGVIPQAIPLARDTPWDDTPTPSARYIVQGSYPEHFSIPYQDAFRKQLSFWLPRDAQPRDFRAVLNFMQRGKLPVRDLISEVAAPADAQRIYTALQNREILTAVFDWRLHESS